MTLKINIEGTNRRFKLPLRDLGASTLPEKVSLSRLHYQAPSLDTIHPSTSACNRTALRISLADHYLNS